MLKRVFLGIIIVLGLGSLNRAVAQPPAHQIFYIDGEPGPELGPSQSHTTSGTIYVPCTGCAVDATGLGDNGCVTWAATENISYVNGFTYLTVTLSFKNNSSSEVDFVACAMAEFKQPTQAYDLGLVPQITTYKLHECPGPPCEYYCENTGVSYGNSETPADGYQSWSYYVGCKEYHLPANGGSALETYEQGFAPGTILAYTDVPGLPNDPVSIWLSTNSPNDNDDTITSWNFNSLYVDFFQDCAINMTGTGSCGAHSEGSCDGLMGGPNVELEPTDCTDHSDNYDPVTCKSGNSGQVCYSNNWVATSRIKTGGGSPNASAACDVGNWVTMSHMDTSYPSRMFVTVANAPAGTKITGYCPYDTLSGGMPVTDSTGLPIVGSGYIFTDTSSGCNSDTLGFQFPFLIPAMANGDMGWEITLPAGSCSDIGNGRRIYLHGEVYAASNTPVYDSGQFMYGVSMTFVLDTTPPTATSFTLHAVDSTHLAVSLTGSDDTTIVNAGYVKYSVNGGSEVSQLLRVQHDSVGLTTIFVDTIISPFPHATINIRGFVANQLGLLDSTAIDTCNLPVIAPASVKDLSADGCHVELIQVDPADRTITLKFETTGGQLTLSLTDELGRVWPISPATNLAPGEEIITRTFPDLPHGAYFLRLQTGTCDVLEKVIL